MILLIGVVLYSSLPLLTTSDNLELLSTSLRPLERAACEEITLSCPQGTSISLLSAKYTEDVLCPGASSACHFPKSLQYSLLQTAVERCQKKRLCKLQPSADGLATDPCPGVIKHLHVVYSCRPYEFRSKTACENEVVQLECVPNTRLAIYSASYGRTQYESVQCPQPQGVPEETCLASYATETVINFCHGKRRCDLAVDTGTFGSPCKKESRMYLKVVYTCVPKQVLLPKYEQRPEEDEPLYQTDVWADNEVEGLAAPNTIGQRRNGSVSLHRFRDIMSTYRPDEEGISADYRGRMTLYLAAAGGAAACLLAVALLVKLACARADPQLPPATELCQADLALAASFPTEASEVVRYSAKDLPRILASTNSQYYF